MVYIVLSDNFELDDCWHGSGSDVEYVSLNKEKSENFLEKMRNNYITMENNEIGYNEPTRFSITIGNWSYNYELLELPEDIDLRYYRYGGK